MPLLPVLLAAVRFAQTPATAPPVPSAPVPSAPVQSAPALTALPAPPAWDKLKAAYDYKPAVPNAPAPLVAARDDADYVLQHITLSGADGKPVPGLYLRPKADGKYPVALLLHGLGSDKETMIRFFGRALAARGIACLALDALDHGERKTPGAAAVGAGSPAGERGGLRFATVVRQTVGDYRLALDYLKTRKDVDANRVGLLGYSMGAMMGSVLGGVDDRVKAVVLEVGGDPVRPFVSALPPAARDTVEFISPSNYVGHIAPRPVLMINAKADQTMRADAAKRLQDAARDPKQIIWAEGGHILAAPDAQKGVDWLVERLTTKK